MKRTFRIGPFLPAAAVAAALSVCLIFVSLPATAVVSPQTQTAPPQTVRSASEPVLIEQPVRSSTSATPRPPRRSRRQRPQSFRRRARP